MGSLVASQQLTQGDVIFVTEPPEYEGGRENIIVREAAGGHNGVAPGFLLRATFVSMPAGLTCPEPRLRVVDRKRDLMGKTKQGKPAPAWEDASSYARGERGNVDPKAWGLTLESEPRPGTFRRSTYILVHRYTGCDGWFLTCRDLGLDTRELGDISADEAKQQAVDIVAQAMSARIEALQEHLAQLKAWSDG